MGSKFYLFLIFLLIIHLSQATLASTQQQELPSIKEGVRKEEPKEPKPAEPTTPSQPSDWVPYDFSKYNNEVVFWAPGKMKRTTNLVRSYEKLVSPKHEEVTAVLGPILEGQILTNSSGLSVNNEGDVIYKGESYNLIFFHEQPNKGKIPFPESDQKILREKFSEQARKLLSPKSPVQTTPSKSTTGGSGLGYKPPWGGTAGYRPSVSGGSSSAKVTVGGPSSKSPQQGNGVTPPDGKTPAEKVGDTPPVQPPVPPAPGFKELVDPVLKRLEDASKKIQPQQTWQDAKAFIKEHLPHFENIRGILSKSDSAFSRRLEEEIEKSRVYLGDLERPYLQGQATPPKLITELITNSNQTIKILHKVYWEMTPENKAYAFLYALMMGMVPEVDLRIKELKAISFSQAVFKHEEQMKGALVAIDKKTWDALIRKFVISAQTMELEALTDEMVIYRDRVKAKLGSLLPNAYLSELNELVRLISEAARNSYLSDTAKVFGGAIPSNVLDTQQLQLIGSVRKLVAQKAVEPTKLGEKLNLIGLLVEALIEQNPSEDQIQELMESVRRMKEKKTDNSGVKDHQEQN